MNRSSLLISFLISARALGWARRKAFYKGLCDPHRPTLRLVLAVKLLARRHPLGHTSSAPCRRTLSYEMPPTAMSFCQSTLCLQCWHVHSLHFRGWGTEHRSQQRRYRCGDRNRLSDLVIQAAAMHLGARRYELTDW